MDLDETWACILAPTRAVNWLESVDYEGDVLDHDRFVEALRNANAYDIHRLVSMHGSLEDSWLQHIQPESLPFHDGHAPITVAARDAVFFGRYDFTYDPVKRLMCEVLRSETYEDHGIDIEFDDVLRMIGAGLPLFPRDRFGCPLWTTFVHRDDLAELVCFVHLIHGGMLCEDVLRHVRSFVV